MPIPQKKFTLEEYQRLYHVELKTIAEIARLEGCPKGTTRHRMLVSGIQFRDRREAKNLQTARGFTRTVPPTTALCRTEADCKGCGALWKPNVDGIYDRCPFCGKRKDLRIRAAGPKDAERKKKLIQWHSDADNRKARGAKQRQFTRKRIFFRICGSISPRCMRCGCDEPKLLEINHKNGGGAQETLNGKLTSKFYHAIANGSRPTDDLELLCKPCNAIHALELKYGPLPMKVVWAPQGSS